MSQEKDILSEYLETLIVNTGDGLHVSTYSILHRLPLLEKVAHAITSNLNQNTEYLCIIAMSGLPLGVAVARELQLPLVFYSKDAWNNDRDIGAERVLGKLPQGARVSIFDAYIASNDTIIECYQYLTAELEVKVLQILTVIDFQIQQKRLDGVDYSILGTAQELSKTLCEILGTNNLEEAEEIYFQEEGFWHFHRSSHIKRRTNLTSKLKSLVGMPGPIKPISIGSNECKERLDLIPDDNIGIWEFLKKAHIVHLVATECIGEIDFTKASNLVGLDILGGTLALYLALNMNFSGSVFIYHPEYGLLPKSKDLGGQKSILVQVRLDTGRNAMEALQVIEDRGGQVSTLLAIKRTYDISNPRVLSLRKLISSGVQIFTID